MSEKTITELELELGRANTRIQELEAKLLCLGDLAVGFWDDKTVGEVDTMGIKAQKYKDILHTMFIEHPKRIQELKKDKARLDWLIDDACVIEPTPTAGAKLHLFSGPSHSMFRGRNAIDAVIKNDRHIESLEKQREEKNKEWKTKKRQEVSDSITRGDFDYCEGGGPQ